MHNQQLPCTLLGGYIAAWLAGIEIRSMVYWSLIWGITTMLTIYLFTSAAGSVIGGGFSVMGSAVQARA
jgi:hypothetical protein